MQLSKVFAIPDFELSHIVLQGALCHLQGILQVIDLLVEDQPDFFYSVLKSSILSLEQKNVSQRSDMLFFDQINLFGSLQEGGNYWLRFFYDVWCFCQLCLILELSDLLVLLLQL